MTPRAYLLAGFLFILLAMSGWSHAETIPSTTNTEQLPLQTKYRLGYTQCGANQPFSALFATPQAACQCGVGVATNPTPTDVTSASGGTCYGHTTTNGNNIVGWGSYFSQTGCNDGDTYTAGSPPYCAHVTRSCPAGYSMSPDQLSCTRQDCTRGTKVDSGMYYDSDGNGITKHACINGCWADFKGTGPSKYYSFSSQELDDVYFGDYIADGATCSVGTPLEGPPPQPPEAPEPTDTPEYDCASKGMTWGTVNGTTVCLPRGTPNTPPVETPPETTKEQDSDDNTSKETTTQDTINGDTVTRTTTTVTKDASGNVTGTDTKTTTSPIRSFCEQNPNASVCADSLVTGGGNCQTPPVPSGDAIQSAILRQTWETRCQAEKTAEALGSGNERAQQLAGIGESAFNAASDGPVGDTEEINVSNQISTAKFLSGSGLQDKVVALPMGKSLTIPFSQLNPYLEIFGSLMVIIAMLSAARIVGVF
jgi:hypothetical protein